MNKPIDQEEQRFAQMLKTVESDVSPADQTFLERLKAQTAEAFRAAGDNLPDSEPRPRAIPLRSPLAAHFRSHAVRRFAFAASILIAGVAGFAWWSTHHAGIAFAQVVQAIERITSCTFTLTTQADNGNATTMKVMVLDHHMRVEVDDCTAIFDFDSGKSLTLMTNTHHAFLMEMKGMPDEDKEHWTNWLATLKQQLTMAKTADELGHRQIADHDAVGFQVVNDSEPTTVWVDARSGQILEAQIAHTGMATTVLSDFDLRPQIDPSLFELKPPAGYTFLPVGLSLDLQNVSEQDLLDFLDLWTRGTDGYFPDYLTFGGKDAKVRARSLKDEIGVLGLLQTPQTITRGAMFMNHCTTDRHYVGAGVLRGQADKPVFWYQPKGNELYRVIYGDLSVREMPKDQLPPVPPAPATRPTPTLVQSTPAPGAIDVDPATEIRLTFDQDMRRQGQITLQGSQDNFQLPFKPNWLDHRTCTVPATLKPNGYYTLTINPSWDPSLLSGPGTAVQPTTIEFTTGPASEDAALPSEQNVQALDKLRTALLRDYDQILGRFDLDKQISRFTSTLAACKAPSGFAMRLRDMLADLLQPRISIGFGHQEISLPMPNTQPNASWDLLPKVVPVWRQADTHGSVYTGKFDPDIAYINLRNWWAPAEKGPTLQIFGYAVLGALQSGPANTLKSAAVESLATVTHAKGLIIDIRNNGQTNGIEYAQALARCFIDQPVTYAREVARNMTEDKPKERRLEPDSAAKHFAGRIVLLTSPTNAGTSEYFALMMKQVPGCTLIGSRTAGAFGDNEAIDLGNGVIVNLPKWIPTLPDGTDVSAGVSPDIEVPATQDDLRAGHDPVLEAALNLLRQ